MSLALVRSRALAGLEAPEVIVEVHLANGLPSFSLVGLPDTEVKEARERVRAALATCQFEFPARRITVNLAPADLPKESGRFDLAIALGILAASGQLRTDALEGYEFAGELSLSGELRPVRGALAMAWRAADAGRVLVLPQDSAIEAVLVRRAQVLAAPSLLAVVAHLGGHATLQAPPTAPPGIAESLPDLAEVRGQAQARRALEIAAAGGHSLLMFGPPGTGKSMLAARLPGLLPPLAEEEALEVAALHSLAGRFQPAAWCQRPWRAPHHSASVPALVGGGMAVRPGEISLAHRGILFLDELPEWPRPVLEALREPLEVGRITVSRAARQVDYPAAFQLVAAMNPCPCGYRGHPTRACRCTPDQVGRYLARISGPLLDRIDLAVELAPLSVAELQALPTGEDSAAVRGRVARARAHAWARQGCANSALDPAALERYARPQPAAAQLLARAIDRLGLSARAYHRLLRVARTLADLAHADDVAASHAAEALQFRQTGALRDGASKAG